MDRLFVSLPGKKGSNLSERENVGRSLCDCHHGTKFIPLANNTNYFYANIN